MLTSTRSLLLGAVPSAERGCILDDDEKATGQCLGLTRKILPDDPLSRSVVTVSLGLTVTGGICKGLSPSLVSTHPLSKTVLLLVWG